MNHDEDDENIGYRKKPYGYSRQIDWINKSHTPYGRRKKDILFGIYLLSILLWGLLISYLQPSIGIYGWIILFIPLFALLISTLSLNSLSRIVEDGMSKHNVLSISMLIVLPLLGFITKDFKGDHALMIKVVLLAITFTLLSMLEIWVEYKWLTIIHHVRSIFQTAALTLILFALYLYYSSTDHLPWVNTISPLILSQP